MSLKRENSGGILDGLDQNTTTKHPKVEHAAADRTDNTAKIDIEEHVAERWQITRLIKGGEGN